MFNFFMLPGRLMVKLLFQGQKRAYRSARVKDKSGPGTVFIALVFWLAIGSALVWGADKAGLLKGALDAGVQVASPANDNLSQPESVDNGDVPFAAPPDETVTSLSGVIAEGQGSPGLIAMPINPSTTAAEGVEVWLVILHTIPKNARDEAERRQAQYRNRGLRVEIMDTDAFPRL
ncbi:MAG: hypothetical protein ACRCTY_04355, partial [Candidatus Adiutrix sp.]